MGKSDMMANLFGADSEEEEEENVEREDSEEEGAAAAASDEEYEQAADNAMEDDENEDRSPAQASEDGAEEEAEEAGREANSEEEEEERLEEDNEGEEREEDGQQERNELEDDIEDVEEAGPAGEEEYEHGSYRRPPRERPVGPPIELELPLLPPPGQPQQMHVVKTSNIMGIEMKPFDPDTYEDQEPIVEDESGRRLKLDENIVRWREVETPSGEKELESNARFVKWSDGSMQLFIGAEVLNIGAQQTRASQHSFLFLRHKGGVLQSQGRLLQKMKFMPSSLTSKSHKLLTALVDNRHKKVFKVKKVVTTVDPDKDKANREKEADMIIRSNEELMRKQEREMRKYGMGDRGAPSVAMGGFEGANRRRGGGTGSRRGFDEELEERNAEDKILQAKKDASSFSRSQKVERSGLGRRASMNERLRESDDEEAAEEEEEEEEEGEYKDSDEEEEQEEEEEGEAGDDEQEDREASDSDREERSRSKKSAGREAPEVRGSKRKAAPEEERVHVSRRRVVESDSE